MYQSQYPWRTRLAFECRGFMYFVDVGEDECLDVARGLWLAGADYLSLHVRGTPMADSWLYRPTAGAYRGSQAGGYSTRAA